jgi:hypothetical protein
MWASPNNIPTNISFISSGIVIKVLSAEDKRTIPLVELATYKIRLAHKRLVI